MAAELQAAMRRFPDVRDKVHRAAQKALEAASAKGAPEAWFSLGYFREIDGDNAGAVEAFRQALARGLPPSTARVYAEQALERLQ